MTVDDQFVLAAGTIEVADFRRRTTVAAAAGYTGIGVSLDQYRAARTAGTSDGDMRHMLADSGLSIVEIQSVQGWAGSPTQRARARAQTAACLQIADRLGGRYLSVNSTDLDADLDSAAAGFADIAAMAADSGMVAALEFLPWGPVPDIRTAWSVVAASGCANGSVLMDSWHHFQAGGDTDALDGVPPDRIAGIQISDGRLTDRAHLRDASRNDRVHPGLGEFDLQCLVRTLDSRQVRAPWSVEVLSRPYRALAPETVARGALQATRSLLAAARDGRSSH